MSGGTLRLRRAGGGIEMRVSEVAQGKEGGKARIRVGAQQNNGGFLCYTRIGLVPFLGMAGDRDSRKES